MKSFDPVSQLISREAIRFIGTVSDLVKNSLEIYLALTKAFGSNEIRSSSELEAVVSNLVPTCSSAVARNTVEVSAGLRILMAIPQGSVSNKKYSLGESGRVIRAATHHQAWDPSKLPLIFMRPMFESHGDYLLQALTAAEKSQTREEELVVFTDLVRELAAAKLSELPSAPSGLSWDTYVSELRQREAAMTGEAGSQGKNGRITFESLQTQHRRRFDELTKKSKPRSGDSGGADSKTFQHQLARCRSWLEDLRLIDRGPKRTVITREGARVLSYFREHSPAGGPVRIPPTAALLSDAFRLTDEVIVRAWGTIVDDEFWEHGLFDLSRHGTYSPAEGELIDVVNWAFDWVRVRQVSEASLSPLRQAVFLAFLFTGRPLKPSQLSAALQTLWETRGDLFGLGRNRQGRPAFVFRKQKT